MPARYALYYAPAPGTPLAGLGDAWLGESPPDFEGLPAARWRAITEAPRRYCFHATLKPPFVLAEGCSLAALQAALTPFAARHRPFRLRLEVGAIGGFIALVPARPSPEAHALADACVVEFDRFRAPPAATEVARRRAAGLSPRQEALLLRWGYPYVLDEFRFHMTLTERLAEPERARVLALLRAGAAAAVAEPALVDAITLFTQPADDAAFAAVARYPFGSDGGRP